MRISGGKARGIPLRATRAPELRPATEANRERLFSSLGQQVEDACILDLFAGTGSYGLEALSRGAAEAYFVEKNRKITKDLQDNLSKVLKSAQLKKDVGKVFQRDVLEFLQAPPQNPYDILFLDPPYAEIDPMRKRLFDRIRNNQFVHSDSLLIHECPAGEYEEPTGWQLIKKLGKAAKGSPVFHFFKITE
ncbi:MAG TPA: methyltransferase [Opitutae bacterium]|nr:methyltransferase [Opitutae bacterium]